MTAPSREVHSQRWRQTITADDREVVHLADQSGEACARCGAAIAPRGVAYPADALVVVLGADPHASWMTSRAATCRVGS